MTKKDPNTFFLTTYWNHYYFIQQIIFLNILLKNFIIKKIDILPGLQRTFRLVLEPIKCWRWSSDVVLSQYHQHNDANSLEPMNVQFWIQHLELISTWKKVCSGIGFLFYYGSKKLMSHTIKRIYSRNQKTTIMITSFSTHKHELEIKFKMAG